MTLTLKFANNEYLEELKSYALELQQILDLETDSIPLSVSKESDGTISIFISDEFFRFSYQFLVEKLLTKFESDDEGKEFIIKMSKEFRFNSGDMLMIEVPR